MLFARILMKKNKNDLLKKIKIFLYRKLYTLLNTSHRDAAVKLFWFKNTQNFGDSLNPILLQTLTGKPVKWVKFYTPEQHYISIGSILETATKDTVVWGSGFISEEKHCFEKPQKICAVRGPKSREILINDGIECPEIYGDPALLLPKIYSPMIQKKYKLGIIPHFIDKDNAWLQNIKQNNDVKFIDIQNPDIFEVIDEILSCEKIASSSLHGIIVADAYHIPSLWVEFSDKVMGKGFKFLDYFLSVNRKDTKPLLINEKVTIEEVESHFYEYSIEINIDKLLEAAPFKIKQEFLPGRENT